MNLRFFLNVFCVVVFVSFACQASVSVSHSTFNDELIHGFESLTAVSLRKPSSINFKTASRLKDTRLCWSDPARCFDLVRYVAHRAGQIMIDPSCELILTFALHRKKRVCVGLLLGSLLKSLYLLNSAESAAKIRSITQSRRQVRFCCNFARVSPPDMSPYYRARFAGSHVVVLNRLHRSFNLCKTIETRLKRSGWLRTLWRPVFNCLVRFETPQSHPEACCRSS